MIHRNKPIVFNSIFGQVYIGSPYLWCPGKEPSKPLIDEMKIYHNGRSEAVNRALSDFGIEDSFASAAKRFEEHYHYAISSSTVSGSTKNVATEAMEYIENKLSCGDQHQSESMTDKMLVELDGCEIRTAQLVAIEDTNEKTEVYGNSKKRKNIKWRDVRMGFVKPLDSKTKTYIGKMGSYPDVVRQLHDAAVLTGMKPETEIIGVADGGIGLSEELKKQFPNMQFILDKSHLKDHFYETAESLGIVQEDRRGWVEPRIRKISDGNVESILEELKAENKKNPNDRLNRLIGYLNRFYDALGYNKFRAKGYPIGSGEIESAHKSIPQKRLKLAGASWDAKSINPILALRILRADDWWQDFWKQRAEKLMAA